MRRMKRWIILLTGLMLLLSAGAHASAAQDASLPADAGDMFTDRDLEIGYDEETSAYITLSSQSISTTSATVEIAGGAVTIREEGVYILSGTLEDGMIIIDAGDTQKVQLVLNGVSITSATSAAIYVRSADKVFITTAAATENTLANGGTYVAIDDNNIDAVIFSKSDLTLNGAGTLTIQAAAGHGVVSKDDLVFASGTYQITAADHGISGKDSVRIASGSYAITSGKDGIHAENADDASLGFLYIAGGAFSITAEGDGLSAASYLWIADGEFDILSGGGSANVSQDASTGQWSFWNHEQTSDDSDISAKGIKSSVNVTIQQGVFRLDSADDALHSNDSLTLLGGTFAIATGDDGIHADGAVLISDGTIDISESYEGIEGLTIDITGGVINLVSSDDGLNAAGGNDSSGFGRFGGDMFSSTDGAYIHIAGGSLYIDASGDGIDSNGDLLVSGGEVYVCGPTNSGNGALDYSGEGTVTGGTVISVGAAGMAQNFGSASTQGVIMVNVGSASAGSTITLSDSQGNVLLSWQASKSYASVVVSCPGIVQGETYTLTADGSSTQVVMDTLVYGSGGMGGGPGGGRGGDWNSGGGRWGDRGGGGRP